MVEASECFCLECRALQASQNTILRQSTEVADKIGFVPYAKVCNDTDPNPPVRSRDRATLAGCDVACDNLGSPYSGRAKDLGRPEMRDTWLDQGKGQSLCQRDAVAHTSEQA